MSKTRSWLCVIKRLFFSESHHLQQQKCKRRWLFGGLKRTKGLPSLVPESKQPEIPIEDYTKQDVEEIPIQCDETARKSVSNGELVVRKCSTESIESEARVPQDDVQLEGLTQNLAATKIQTSYRGHLARKALRALKGFVTLQAIIRGRAVRRQAVTTLKCLQSIVSIQSEVIAKRRQMSQGKYKGLQSQDLRNEKHKAQQSRERRLDNELLSKGEEIDMILRKKEAILRKQRTRAYSFNHRNSADSENRNADGRLRYWLEQYVSDQPPKKEDKSGGKQPKLRNIECLDDSVIISVPRRSFHTRKTHGSYAEDNLNPGSPPNSLPTYMAATKSAKAKTRSLSTPRLRPVHFDSFLDSDSPYKHKISPMSSINSEVTCSSIISKASNRSCYPSFQQRSPNLKGMSALIEI